MKYLPVAITMSALLFWAAGLFAQNSVYSWTDSDGVLNITNRKPNPTAPVEDVKHYKPAAAVEKVGRQRDPEKEREVKPDEKEARELKAVVDRAEKNAKDAKDIAEKARKQADTFRKRVGNNSNRKRKNRVKMQKLDKQAEQAEAQARDAAKIFETARDAAVQTGGASVIDTRH